MACYNWPQGEAAIHFHIPTTCGMLLMIRVSNVLELVEYFLHLNSILIQVEPANLDTLILFIFPWLQNKQIQLDNQNINKI